MDNLCSLCKLTLALAKLAYKQLLRMWWTAGRKHYCTTFRVHPTFTKMPANIADTHQNGNKSTRHEWKASVYNTNRVLVGGTLHCSHQLTLKCIRECYCHLAVVLHYWKVFSFFLSFFRSIAVQLEAQRHLLHRRMQYECRRGAAN